MKILIEKMQNEDWRSNVAAGFIGATLAASPISHPPADAATKTTVSHKKHSGLPHKNYSEQDIINSIVGEAGGEGYDGMRAVASAIRNRYHNNYYKNNILHGVYGKNAAHIKKESQKTFDLAKKAWEDSKTQGTVGRAYLWGNDADVDLFKKQKWFNNVKLTTRVGGHNFFEDKRK